MRKRDWLFSIPAVFNLRICLWILAHPRRMAGMRQTPLLLSFFEFRGVVSTTPFSLILFTYLFFHARD
jgi:hypothetical protein